MLLEQTCHLMGDFKVLFLISFKDVGAEPDPQLGLGVDQEVESRV